MNAAAVLSANPRAQAPWEPPSLIEMQSLLPEFQFIALIGRGGMGAVFKATQVSLNRPVAVKVLPEDLAQGGDATFADRFRQEALTMARLAHPGIVGVLETGEAGGLLYIVMEFVDGADVARMIQSEGKLAPELAIKLLTQVCDALQYAHQNNVVHRDIKPANLLLTRDGTVKIADFGLAKRQDELLLNLTKTNVAIGTPDFLAPEAWTPGAPLDSRADLYAVGVTLYQMLTGQVPRGLWEMPSERVGSDPRFDAIIERAMQPRPEARYQSSVELRRDLERIEKEPAKLEPEVDSQSSGPQDKQPRTAKRSRLVALAAAVIVCIVGLVFAWPTLSRGDATPPTVRDAALWLVREKADFKVISEGREFEVKSEQDIPAGNFQIVHLWFDRWVSSPQQPPPDKEFQVLNAVTTLRYCFIRLPGISDSALAFLTNNPNIQTLLIGCPDKLTDQVFTHFAGMNRLEWLDISHSPKITGKGIAGSAWLKSIRTVDFLYASLNDSVFHTFASCPVLEDMRLEGTTVTAEQLKALIPSRSLSALTIGGPNLSSLEMAEILPQFQALRKLNLPQTTISEELGRTLATLTNLTELILSGHTVTDELLVQFAGLTKLEKLKLFATATTEKGRASFLKAHPNCQIELLR